MRYRFYLHHNYAFRVCHLNSVSVSQGQEVAASDVIGIIGNTGASQCSHAHCALYRNITANYSGFGSIQPAYGKITRSITISESGNNNVTWVQRMKGSKTA